MADRVNTQSPTTEAGRALLEEANTIGPVGADGSMRWGADWPARTFTAEAILAIEEAARAEGRREAVHEIRDGLPVAVLATDGGPAIAYAMRVTEYLDGLIHTCSESCLHDCHECGHEVDHTGRFHSPTCRSDRAALNASESPPTDEDDDAERTYTEDEYIDYGVVQYRRGKAQAEYEAAHPVGDASESGPTERRCFCGEPAEWPDGKCDKHHSRRGLGDTSESVQPPESHDDE